MRESLVTRRSSSLVTRYSSSLVTYHASRDFKDDFPCLARLDRADRLVELVERKPMRDDRRRIELPRAQKPRHLVPRVVHPTTHDAVDQIGRASCREKV